MAEENKGLNFIDISAVSYYTIIETYLKKEGKEIDKPFAFLLNPPYKNTDENVDGRIDNDAEYPIHETLQVIAGNDASKERYILFLSQILEMCKTQTERLPNIEPIVMIFTPTPWLIPRPTFSQFRSNFDNYFKFEKGFMVNGENFFKEIGRWPVSFTIWKYNQKKNKNKIVLLDLTELNSLSLASIPWNNNLETINLEVKKIIKGKKEVLFDNSRIDIRDSIPKITKNNHIQHQPRYNMYRNKTKAEIDLKTISGFPLKALKHHEKKDPYGYTDGTFVGFMMDGTPCRIKMDTCNRLSNKPDRVWLKLDNYFKNTNFTSITSGPPDKYGFCSYDLPTAQSLFSFYSITKVFNGNYPIWANQFDIWAPNIKETFSNEYFSLCFSYCLFDNRCVTMQFEKDNPVLGVPEIFIDNPLCPTNSESFWSKTLDAQIKYPLAKDLVDEIKSLYEYWNIEYCKGQFIKNCGLEDEAYFKYFDYPDFITPYSGLIQIRKYAEKNGKTDIIERFDKIKIITKKVKESIYDLLVNEFKYFE